MITDDLACIVGAMTSGHPKCWHAGMTAEQVADLREALVAVLYQVDQLERSMVPPHLRALDARVVSLRDVAERQKLRNLSRFLVIEGGVA